MRKFLLLFLITILILILTTSCKHQSTTPVSEHYSTWEESVMAHNEEYLVWRRNALLDAESSYAVWEENELSRNKVTPVFENE